MQTYDKLYINGAWVKSAGNESIEVFNAATEEVMATIPAGTVSDADAAVKAARAAFDSMVNDERGGAHRLLAKNP